MPKSPRHTRTSALIGSGIDTENTLYHGQSEPDATTPPVRIALIGEETING